MIGSDEVWNFLDPKSFSPIKFSAGLTAERIVAYAPSTGKAAGAAVPDDIRAAMRGFSALSARDKGAQALCEAALGVVPPLVCDPTFLTATPVIDNEKIEALTKKPYALFYYCNGIPRELKKSVIDRAHADGLAVLGGGEYDKLYSAMSVRLTPFEWAELFRRAARVYTGTFHGVVFSILNKKDFLVYASIDSRVKKIAALLDQFGIADRSLTADALNKQNDAIDYEAVYRYVDRLRSDSSDYLFNAIKGEIIHDSKQS